MEFKDTKKTKKTKKEEVKRSKRNEKLHENLGFQDEVTGSGLTLPLKQINNNNKKTYMKQWFLRHWPLGYKRQSSLGDWSTQ